MRDHATGAIKAVVEITLRTKRQCLMTGLSETIITALLLIAVLAWLPTSELLRFLFLALSATSFALSAVALALLTTYSSSRLRLDFGSNLYISCLLLSTGSLLACIGCLVVGVYENFLPLIITSSLFAFSFTLAAHHVWRETKRVEIAMSYMRIDGLTCARVVHLLVCLKSLSNERALCYPYTLTSFLELRSSERTIDALSKLDFRVRVLWSRLMRMVDIERLKALAADLRSGQEVALVKATRQACVVVAPVALFSGLLVARPDLFGLSEVLRSITEHVLLTLALAVSIAIIVSMVLIRCAVRLLLCAILGSRKEVKRVLRASVEEITSVAERLADVIKQAIACFTQRKYGVTLELSV